MEEKLNTYRVLVGKPLRKETKRKRYIRRWEENIKIDLREIGWSGTDWINLTQDRDQWQASVNTVMNLEFS
jgi:hypothetical protein